MKIRIRLFALLYLLMMIMMSITSCNKETIEPGRGDGKQSSAHVPVQVETDHYIGEL